jgi:hypothetical protein
MSLSKQLIDEISRANSLKSGVPFGDSGATAPKSTPGKQRSRMNAVKYNLSGQHMIFIEAETKVSNRIATLMLMDLKPKTEPERPQAVRQVNEIKRDRCQFASFGRIAPSLLAGLCQHTPPARETDRTPPRRFEVIRFHPFSPELSLVLMPLHLVTE